MRRTAVDWRALYDGFAPELVAHEAEALLKCTRGATQPDMPSVLSIWRRHLLAVDAQHDQAARRSTIRAASLSHWIGLAIEARHSERMGEQRHRVLHGVCVERVKRALLESHVRLGE